MTRVVVSPQANARDLGAVHERLEMFPAIGAPRPKLGSNARIAVLSPYVVIYDHTPEEGTVTIIRVLDGRRNITRRLVRG